MLAAAAGAAAVVTERPKQRRMSARKSVSGIRSLPGFSGNQFPVRIACADIAGEGPDGGNVSQFFSIAVDHFAVFVTCDRNKLGLKPHGHLRIASAQYGSCNVGVVD